VKCETKLYESLQTQLNPLQNFINTKRVNILYNSITAVTGWLQRFAVRLRIHAHSCKLQAANILNNFLTATYR